MILAWMLSTDEDAVICDFAETYHVYDLRSLPLKTAAALAAGLRRDSRIKMRISGAKLELDTWLLALAADHIRLLWWAKTKDGQHGRNKPQSVLEMLTREHQESQTVGFASGEDFMAERQRIMTSATKGA